MNAHALADDWGSWASRCAERRDPEPSAPAELTLTFTGVGGRDLGRMRIDVATGAVLPPGRQRTATVTSLDSRRAR